MHWEGRDRESPAAVSGKSPVNRAGGKKKWGAADRRQWRIPGIDGMRGGSRSRSSRTHRRRDSHTSPECNDKQWSLSER